MPGALAQFALKVATGSADTPTGVTSMMKKRLDLWLALCVLCGVVLVLLAGFHRLGVDLELPVLTRP